MTYTVTVSTRKGYMFSCLTFNDKDKARDHYTDMLVRYPNAHVEFLPSEK